MARPIAVVACRPEITTAVASAKAPGTSKNGRNRCTVLSLTFEVDDHRGESIRLYDAQWSSHILKNHPEMADGLDGIKLTISDPDVVVVSTSRGLRNDCERVVASRRGAHPAWRDLYLRVVIEYAPTGKNWVCTSYLNPLPPSGEIVYVRFSPR